jgi:hypothetical protein
MPGFFFLLFALDTASVSSTHEARQLSLMNLHSFELLREVETLLSSDSVSQRRPTISDPEATAPPLSVSPPTAHPSIATAHNSTRASLHQHSGNASRSFHSAHHEQDHVGRHALQPHPWTDDDEFRDDFFHRRAVEETIDDTIGGDDKAFAVLDALLTTARQNTDLTELDIVCRRVRQSEIDQLQQGLEVLDAYSNYIKKRCNVLYSEINAVNDQQAQLVACLEAALQATIGDGPTSSSAAHHGAPQSRLSAGQQQQRGVTSLPDDNQSSSAAGSLRGPSRGVAAQALSSSSSQSGGRQQLAGTISLNSRSQGVFASPQQQRQGLTSGGGAVVSPYRVLGGPFDRSAMQTLLATHAGVYE